MPDTTPIATAITMPAIVELIAEFTMAHTAPQRTNVEAALCRRFAWVHPQNKDTAVALIATQECLHFAISPLLNNDNLRHARSVMSQGGITYYADFPRILKLTVYCPLLSLLHLVCDVNVQEITPRSGNKTIFVINGIK